MKKFTLIVATLLFFLVPETKAQSFDIGTLDNAISLLKNGKQKESSKVLGPAMKLLTNSVSSNKKGFGGKILSQVGGLSDMLPALSKGNGDAGKAIKSLSMIKMLMGALNLNNMLKGGSLLNKSSDLLSNVNLLQSGLGLLKGGAKMDQLTSSLGKIAKKAPKLGKSGFCAKRTDKGIAKKLTSSLSLLNGLL